jgi:hypothetical protein
VQFIANIPADVQLVFAARFTTPLVNSAAYSAVTSGAFSALISKVADVNRTHFAKMICKKMNMKLSSSIKLYNIIIFILTSWNNVSYSKEIFVSSVNTILIISFNILYYIILCDLR